MLLFVKPFFSSLAVTEGNQRKSCEIYTLTFCKANRLFSLHPFLQPPHFFLPTLLLFFSFLFLSSSPPLPRTAPNSTVTIVVTPLNPRSIRVQWTPVTPNNATFDNTSITGYQVTTVTSGGTSRQFTVNNASASEYTFTGLSPYQYASDGDPVHWMTTVRVVNSFGIGPNSNTARTILPCMCSYYSS